MKLKRIIALTTITTFFVFTALFPVPQKASAQVAGLPFGGFDWFMFPCTCAAGSLFFHFFLPLYLESVPTAGFLVTPPTPVAFSTYYVRPGSWALGDMIPGAGTGCWIGVAPYCTLVPNYGYITPFTGVSPTA